MEKCQNLEAIITVDYFKRLDNETLGEYTPKINDK